jgi:glycosyltransferase involved in cell wall biosynthesis
MTSEKIRLVAFTGGSGYDSSGSIWLQDESVRKWFGLLTEFDLSLLAVRVGTDKRRTTRMSAGTKVTWLPRFGKSALRPRYLKQIWKEIRDSDAFLTFMPELRGIVPLLLAFIARKPRYILLQASSAHFRSWHSVGYGLAIAGRVLINCLGLLSTRVLVQGSDFQHEFVRPIRRKCVEVLISTLSEEDFRLPSPPDSERIRLLTVARLVRIKRIDVVLRATKLLLDRGLEVHLTVLGEGPLRDDLLDLARRLDIEDRVELAGLIDDPAKLRDQYEAASVFVLASETEGVSLAAIEAMAAGTPVVATAPGGMEGFLANGSDSIVVREPEPNAFADAIEKLVADHGLYLRIAEQAQEKVRPYSNKAWVVSLAKLIAQDLRRA